LNIAILVTDFNLKKPMHATVRLARELTNGGHSVWFFTADGFSLGADDRLSIVGVKVPVKTFRSNRTYLETLQSCPSEKITTAELDVLFLRDNPARYTQDRSWARQAVALFSRFAVDQGVLVLNDPTGLTLAQNKLYFQTLPPKVRSKTLITRNPQDIREFAEELDGDLILKPLQGSGGESVFLVKKGSTYNFNQLVESSLKIGYVIAQEYLPAAEEGDIRLYLMNGNPLQKNGHYAAFRRRRSGDDIRSNMHAGGQVEAAVITPEVLDLCAQVKSRIVEDGLFLVGLDIVGDKIIEVNVFCPGGLNSMEKIEGVNFSAPICKEIERKFKVHSTQPNGLDNRTLATMA